MKLRYCLTISTFLQVTAFITCAAAQDLSPEKKVPPAPPAPFSPACSSPTYPKPAPAALVVDSKCGIDGAGGDEAVQNAVKNNFCASGTPTTMTITDLQQLQAQVEEDPTIDFGNENKPPRHQGPAVDRAALQKLGEGKLVSLQAFVVLARQEGPESVDCGDQVPDQSAFHDIHIELADSAKADECSGVVAEMIPHHRPTTWTAENVQKVLNAKTMVQVTGQLFFDSSHFPCEGGTPPAAGNPSRSSLWEIHPIYKFEVCKGDCTSTGGQWIPLDQWVSGTKPSKGGTKGKKSPQ